MPNLSTSSLRRLGAALAAATLAAPLLLWAVVPAHALAVVAPIALVVPFLTMGLLEAAAEGDGRCAS